MGAEEPSQKAVLRSESARQAGRECCAQGSEGRAEGWRGCREGQGQVRVGDLSTVSLTQALARNADSRVPQTCWIQMGIRTPLPKDSLALRSWRWLFQSPECRVPEIPVLLSRGCSKPLVKKSLSVDV